MTVAVKQAASAIWRPPATALSETSLRALMAGEIPAIRLPGFATADECCRFCDAIRGAADLGRPAATTPMTLIGSNFANHVGTRSEYFHTVEPSYGNIGRLTAATGWVPLTRMIERLRAVWPGRVDIAAEPGFGRYFAGGIKTRTGGSSLHYDFARHTASDHAIGAVEDQLGCNLYLELPAHTGQTTVYNYRVPRDGGAAGRGNAKHMGLDARVIAGAEFFTFRPSAGEVVIINTRNPHEIDMDGLLAGEWRAQTSSFIGRLANDDLTMWS